MSAKKYSKEHEWIAVAGGIGTVGISDHAQEQLGDIVFVDLPAIGKTVDQHGQICVVESVKAASEVYSPVSGTVTEINGALATEPQAVNRDAEGAGWFFKIKLAKPAELDGLMDEAAYRAFVAGAS